MAKTRAGKSKRKSGKKKGAGKKAGPQYRTIVRHAETSATKAFAPVQAAEPSESTTWRTTTKYVAPDEPFYHSRKAHAPRNDPFAFADTALAGVSNALSKLPTKHKVILLGGAAVATLTVWTLAARAARAALGTAAPTAPAGNVRR